MNLNEELEKLNQMILKMADTVQEHYRRGMDIYQNYDKDKQYEMIDDSIIDHQEREIEEECLNILVRERPYAGDLRRVSGILKLVADLEAIGDYGEDVMNFSLKLQNVERHKIPQIDEMVEVVLKMVNDCIFSYVKQDINLANEVIKKDDIVDEMYASTVEYLIEANRTRKVSSAFAIYTTLVIKYMERAADRAVNVAEWVVYIKSGFHKDKKIF